MAEISKFNTFGDGAEQVVVCNSHIYRQTCVCWEIVSNPAMIAGKAVC